MKLRNQSTFIFHNFLEIAAYFLKVFWEIVDYFMEVKTKKIGFKRAVCAHQVLGSADATGNRTASTVEQYFFFSSLATICKHTCLGWQAITADPL